IRRRARSPAVAARVQVPAAEAVTGIRAVARQLAAGLAREREDRSVRGLLADRELVVVTTDGEEASVRERRLDRLQLRGRRVERSLVHLERAQRDRGRPQRQLRLAVLALRALVEERGQRDRGHDGDDQDADEQLHYREAALVAEGAGVPPGWPLGMHLCSVRRGRVVPPASWSRQRPDRPGT